MFRYWYWLVNGRESIWKTFGVAWQLVDPPPVTQAPATPTLRSPGGNYSLSLSLFVPFFLKKMKTIALCLSLCLLCLFVSFQREERETEIVCEKVGVVLKLAIYIKMRGRFSFPVRSHFSFLIFKWISGVLRLIWVFKHYLR